MSFFKQVALSSIALILLSSCGQKGPLYLPEKVPSTLNQEQNDDPSIH